MNQEKEQYSYLGFDFGLRRIGVAVGQTVTNTASPLPIIAAKQGIPNWQIIKGLIQVWNPAALIVGIPLQMDENEFTVITQKARTFAAALYKHFNLPVYFIDERLTTKAAREYIYNNFGYRALQKQPIDSFAAKIILESWMNQEARS